MGYFLHFDVLGQSISRLRAIGHGDIELTLVFYRLIGTLAGAITDWPALLNQCYIHLKPGGKLEVAEGRANQWWAHNSVPEDSYTYKWLMEWRKLSVALQFDVFPKLQVRGRLLWMLPDSWYFGFLRKMHADCLTRAWRSNSPSKT